MTLETAQEETVQEETVQEETVQEETGEGGRMRLDLGIIGGQLEAKQESPRNFKIDKNWKFAKK